MKNALFLTLMATALPLHATRSLNWLDDDRLTGDWRGARSAAEDAGFKYFAYYSGIFTNNVAGGNSEDSSYSGDLFLGMEFDMETLLGWDATRIVISGIDRHGRSIDEAVGGQYSVMQNVGGQNAFLYNITVEKQFLDDTLSLKAGRMTATDDFVGSPYYSYSINNAVNGQIRAALFDGVMSSYPFAVWGARLKYQPAETHYLMLGAFQTSPDMFDRNGQGVDFSIDGEDGLSLFTQIGWNPDFKGRPAHLFLGMNQSFSYDMPKFHSTGTRHFFTRFYGHADWQVHAETPAGDEGLVLFTTFGFTPFEDVAVIPLQSTFGANYIGLFPGREKDRTLFFVTYGGFSGDFANEKKASGGGHPTYELVLEAGHRFQLTPASYIQPDVQCIVRPGGTGRVDPAVVFGVQFGASF